MKIKRANSAYLESIALDMNSEEIERRINYYDVVNMSVFKMKTDN